MWLDDALTGEALEAGVADIIHKPIDVNALQVKAGYLMRQSEEFAGAPRRIVAGRAEWPQDVGHVSPACSVDGAAGEVPAARSARERSEPRIR